jgi:KUP system potassium uptake protein
VNAPPSTARKDLAKLSVAALGIVYGDIGTSPLYAVKECFTAPHGVAQTSANVLGVLSLVLWSLTLVVVVKYLSFIMRADNHGEGGILALLALVSPRGSARTRGAVLLVSLGLFGAALLYGDGVITPAISVLSAVEGLSVATQAFDPIVVPLTVGILLALFLVQRRGTARVGAMFGPFTLVWFGMIFAMGVPWIVREPGILAAVNPLHAVAFIQTNGEKAFLVLGSVVLCITGAEALYADMGHFGVKPIRVAWYLVVFPALIVNYLGQGALLLQRPAVDNPFFELVSGWLLYPVVAIATVAAVIASQALISGAFSLTRQAVQLGYCPRVTIVHTSGTAEGQIYVPEVNGALMVACIALVLGFRSSTNLAAAYGIAVTGTMGITSILFFVVARRRWGWSIPTAGAVAGLFLAIDLAFFSANAVKLVEGGWFPIAVAIGIFTLMTTWKRGREALGQFMRASTLPLDMFLADVEVRKPVRVPGTAVFMTSDPVGAPPVLLHHFKHNKILHEQVLLLSVASMDVPEVPAEDRVTVEDLGQGFFRVSARYGFMQTPNVLEVLAKCKEQGLDVRENDTSYYLGRETLLRSGDSKMAGWRKTLFAFMSRNARSATAFFGLPPNRVVEMGTQIEL